MAQRARRKQTEDRSFLRLIPRHGAFPVALAVGIVAALVAVPLQLGPLPTIVIGANAMFVAYLGLVALEVPRLSPEFLRRHADEENVPIWAILLVTLVIVAICAFSLFSALNGPESALPMVILSGIAAVLLGWFVVHTMAALHYAYEYYKSPSASPGTSSVSTVGGFEWPKGEEPNGVAFLYISYQIGSAMQIADVAVTSNKMRSLIAAHIVFSFLYNTLIVAAAVNVVVAISSG
jgi:uncharacterized membrane protein